MQKYYCKAMSFYGNKIPLENYNDITKPVLFLGLYFKADYDVFMNHKGKIIVFWNGSDVQRLLSNLVHRVIIKSKPAKHYCHNKQLQDELKSIGLDAEITPLFFGYKDDYKVSYNPSEITKVFVNAHVGRETEYGIDIVKELASDIKEIEFHIYGITGESTTNLIYHGQIPEAQMDNEIKNYQGCLRLNAHDGCSQIVIKSELLGLYTIISRNKAEIKTRLLDLKSKTHCNTSNKLIYDLNWFKGLK